MLFPFKALKIDVWFLHVYSLKMSCYIMSSHIHGSDLSPRLKPRSRGGEVSRQARDNSIKVLESEKRRRRSGLQRETDRTHSHFRKTHFSTFFFFLNCWAKLDFSTSWVEFKHFPNEPLKPAEGAQEAGSTGNRKYHEEQGVDFRSPSTLTSDYLNPFCDSLWRL